MALFIAAGAALLMPAALLAHNLRCPAHHLGPGAARAEIVADLHARVALHRHAFREHVKVRPF
ncbi:hypothetical protein [Kribbella soli]|uniref:Uncharacterized protein n=1 Tax=Kribbella soli TaxID=1124743 RepID=A0A4R0HH48_9ACTN|nr:hypothetical protein [Kribbella soli]TCC10605.1 hypothetical protein E0H45_04650 [Kribbella soli]